MKGLNIAPDGLVARLLGSAQPPGKRPPFALARHEVDIADEFCAAFASCEHDLAAVKIFKLGAMRDTDQRRIRQFLDQRLHHLVLAFGVERRGRLVKHDDVRVVQEQTRESEPLFFAARQRLVPRLLLLLDLVFQVSPIQPCRVLP